MQCLLDHIVLNVEDEAKMLKFYSEVLLLEAERMDEYLAGSVPFPSVRLNPATVIDLFPNALWDDGQQTGRQVLNHFCLCLEKEAWQKLTERLAEHAILIEEGPAVRWGAQGSGTSVYFRDPEANLIEARYYDA